MGARRNTADRYAIQGIDSGMNTEIEPAFADDYIFEAFVAETIIQNLKAGLYVDITDKKRNFKHERFRTVVCEYAKKYKNYLIFLSSKKGAVSLKK